jgi:hypothetical protein
MIVFQGEFFPHKFAIFIVTEPKFFRREGEEGEGREEEVNKIKI